jgi:protein-S-isoprenylcysteine O-methyltransferase Ste14
MVGVQAIAKRQTGKGVPVQVNGLVTGISLCWDTLIIVWLVTSLKTKPAAESPGLKSSFTYTFLLLAAFLWLFFGAYVPGLNILLLPHTFQIVGIGFVVTVLGLAVALWARAKLGTNWSADVTYKKDHELIQTGPYAYVRHPIYSGLLLMLIGTALAAGYLGAVVAVPLALGSFVIKLRLEERLMQKHFKGEYETYRKRVGALIPHLP